MAIIEGNGANDGCNIISAVAADSQTKTTTDNDGVSVIWSENDALLVTSKENNTYASIYEIVTAGTKKADFSLKSGETAQSGNLVAVYPVTGSSYVGGKLTWTIPASQTYRAEGVATNLMAMTAQGAGTSTINFVHEAAVIRIPVYADEASNIVSAELSANEVIGGQWYRTVSSATVGDVTVAEGNTVTSVALAFPDGGIEISTESETPTYLNFIVSGAVASMTGLTITLFDNYGDIAVLAKASAQTIVAGHVYKFPSTKVSYCGAVSVDGGEFQKLEDAQAEILASPNGYYVTSLEMKGRTPTKSDVKNFMDAIKDKTSSTSGVDVNLRGLCHPADFKGAGLNAIVGASASVHSLITPSTFKPTANDRGNLRKVRWTKRGGELATVFFPGINAYSINFWSGTNTGLSSDVCWIVNKEATGISGATLCFVAEYAVEPDCANYSVENGVLYDRTKQTLVSYPGAKMDERFEIPSSVTKFSHYCLCDAENLTTLVFPDRSDLVLTGMNGQGSKNLSLIIFKSLSAPAGEWMSVGSNFPKPGKQAGTRKIYIPSDCSDAEKAKYATALNFLTTAQASPNDFTWEIDDHAYTAAQLASDATISSLEGNLVTP